MTASRLIANLQKMFDEAWEQNMSGNGTDLSRMVTTFVPMTIQELSAEEKHGRWDDSGRYRFQDDSLAIRCTECGCALHEDEYQKYHWNYCPNCGARMDGESE